jgi:uncharacterized protein
VPEPRSKGMLTVRRAQQPWPAEREFKILSIDGGGIKGIFPARVLAELEERYLGGRAIAEHFDLITGTSTGGIIALALSIGIPAREIANLYIERGNEIFPPYPRTTRGWLLRHWHGARSFLYQRYDRTALVALLEETFGERLFGEAKARLCIPSGDGRHGDVYIFKTPHHPDYKKDRLERMTTVACATAAAPTFFRPLESEGYRFVDGGLWANNPIMIGLVDALSCFDLDRHQVQILSLGCGDESYTVGDRMMRFGGKLSWIDAILGAMAFQSQNALGQAKLLVGAERVLRMTPTPFQPPIGLDDWERARSCLPAEAAKSVALFGEATRRAFLADKCA